MELIYLFFIAFINSVDNIGIGIAYSIAGVKVQIGKNLLIAFMAFVISLISSFSGNFIAHHISDEQASIISLLLMGGMGIKMIYEAVFDKDGDMADKVRILKYKEAFAIGTVLALDDIPSSVGSGLVGHDIFMISIPYFIISVAIFLLGNYGSRFFTKLKIGKKANIAAGILMILIGISQVLE
jgi:putative Mn2+ efflux pump MntP